MAGVPVPMKAEDLLSSQQGGLQITNLSDNMAVVLGADPGFKYADSYIEFLNKFFDEKLVNVLLSNGAAELKAGRFRRAAVYSRAALVLDSRARDALFGYACCCREWYLSMEGEDFRELIALLKKEANLYFEYCTDADEFFAPPWYYLGYAYLNQGSYKKAQLAWERFVMLSEDFESEPVKEVRERLEDLTEPVKIEEGIGMLLSGRIEEGVERLRPYEQSDYDSWWPLHWYLAQAYEELGMQTEAIAQYEKAASLNPSDPEVYDALCRLYSAAGDAAKAEKYLNKAQLLRERPKESQ